ncbi:MAG: hypothetical protein QXQ40_00885 [Candidatus Aenigmatarchaeota archaeon]
MKGIKALALLSGGLDSRLAIKLMSEIDIEALHFKTPFEGCCLPDCAFKFAQTEAIPLHIYDLTNGRLFQEYIKLIRKPKFGYGSGMNPCIDCRIFMLKKAKQLAKRIGAKFIITGEVLNERPMSQTMQALKLIEKEAKLSGKIVRPLSAKLLPKTEAEKRGWINSNKLLAISGRRRKPQLDLAKRFKLRNFPMPAGGCILCDKGFASKLKDLFEHEKRITPEDIEILKIGRHFRFKESKIIVGRNREENESLIRLKRRTDYVFVVPGCGSPITILRGLKTREAIKKAAGLTIRYSDAKGKCVEVKYNERIITASPLSEKEIEKIRIKDL